MAKPSRPQTSRTEFVQGLQKAVTEAESAGDDLSKRLTNFVSDLVASSKLNVSVGVRSEGAEEGKLRVTCPTPSQAVAEIDGTAEVHSVEFYITRPRKDGVVETRLLGAARYRDGDGRWSVPFVTDRFGITPQDAIAVHVEVLDPNGGLLGANILAAIA
ncbi:hypothetical protein ELH80_01130 [Rhizobium ruizarguesonis]|jgi:hypothetical protein|uniref:hypothetical protein n=1 Tax=Rhizobium ruizarguesonis TaxID=2081791 RepID=UPI0010322ADF|nr:hypothetical protein [Rhizobium ruizarguesonis]TAT76911.1 hypothetical protein ELI56_01140 [Rhizobium ruizarguesonis]TAZ33161.1 hypothetical protein ELH80_01130 [Rhizobium ruizarguesonis]TBC07819.1 hypothetical protein ELH37_01150 [Rhizobium ruizarguesonis]